MQTYMTAPKKIIFYHNCFAIPADVWFLPNAEPLEILLKQVIALDLPKEIRFKIYEKRFLHFPEIFHQHTDTLHSIVEGIRKLGFYVFVRLGKTAKLETGPCSNGPYSSGTRQSESNTDIN